MKKRKTSIAPEPEKIEKKDDAPQPESTKPTPFSTPLAESPSIHKQANENTPKKLESLNKSEIIFTSYTPTNTASPSSAVRPRLSRSLATPVTKPHASSVKRDPSTPKSVYSTPKSVLSEVTDNLISFTPLPTTQKKSMHLIDLTSTQHKRSLYSKSIGNNISATSTPNTSKRIDFTSPKTNKKTVSRNNSLLKSVLKNSAVKINTPARNLARTPNANAAASVKAKIEFSTPVASSQEDSCSSISIISILDSSSTTNAEASTIVNSSTINSSTPKTTSILKKTKDLLSTPSFSGIKKMLKTPSKGPKNDLTNVSGIRGIFNKEPTNDLTNVSGVKRLMQTPKKEPVNDLCNVSGVDILFQTPQAKQPSTNAMPRTPRRVSFSEKLEISVKNDNLQMIEEEGSVGDQSVKTDKETINETSKLNETFDAENEDAKSPLNTTFELDQTNNATRAETSNLNETFEIHSTSTEKGDESNIDSALMDEFKKSMDNTEKLEIDLTTAAVSQHKMSDEEVKQKKEEVLKWIQETRMTLPANELVQQPNPVLQITSSRYSNITPNDSIVDSIVPIADPATRKMSMLDIKNFEDSLNESEQIQCIDESDKSTKSLSKSPISRLSIACETNIITNYILNSPTNLNNEIPKSLRSTRKRIGSALIHLHNVSDVGGAEFNNDTLNLTSQENLLVDHGADAGESEEKNFILSLDGYQNKEPAIDETQEDVAYNGGNYIEFVNSSSEKQDDGEEETEVFEIIDVVENEASPENNENEPPQELESDEEIYSDEEESSSENDLDLTGVEYLDDDQTDENCEEEPETEDLTSETIEVLLESATPVIEQVLPKIYLSRHSKCEQENDSSFSDSQYADAEDTSSASPLFSDTSRSNIGLDLSEILKTDTDETPVKNPGGSHFTKFSAFLLFSTATLLGIYLIRKRIN